MSEPQPLLAQLTGSAVFLVVTIEDGGEKVARDLIKSTEGLRRSVGFRVPDAGLSCVTAIGSNAWDRIFDGPRPQHLRQFEAMHGPRHTAPATPGDILFHIKARTIDVCFELARVINDAGAGAISIVDETIGFRYFEQRDLLGFVDGSENPEGRAAVEAAVVGTEDPDFAGGSYVTVQKYLHDLAAWGKVPTADQERVVGRTKIDNIELSDEAKPADAHVEVAKFTKPDGRERKIIRANMPFGSLKVGEFGTYFIGYTEDPVVIDTMLRRMFLGTEDAAHDRILDFSTAITGTNFFAPSIDFLANMPPLPARPQSAALA